jgi:hypothetical protein
MRTGWKIKHWVFSMALPAHSGPWPLIQFRNNFAQAARLLGRVVTPTSQTPHDPAFERTKPVHALDRAAIVTGKARSRPVYFRSRSTSDVRVSVIHFFIRIVGGGVQTGSTRQVDYLLAYRTCPGWVWGWRIWWNDDWQGKPKYSEKTCPSATLSTTNLTWPDLDSNPRWEASD